MDVMLSLETMDSGPRRVWGNGATFDDATFDNVVLSQAYHRYANVAKPWGYRDDRCYRTLRALFPEIIPMEDPSLVAHNALDAARYQARHMMLIPYHGEIAG